MPLAPDRPDVLPWSRGQPITADRLNRIQSAVITDLTVGPGLKVLRKGNSVSITLANERRFIRNAVLVTVGTALTPGGLYTGTTTKFALATGVTALDPASAATDLSTLLTITGTGTGNACLFVHIPEYGKTTHAITHADNEANKMAIGVYTDIPSTDGKPVIAGISIPYKACT